MPKDRALVNARKDYRDDRLRWTAVCGRDRAADGAFCYSVSSTGVYCKPSCPSRLPRRENVVFHATPAAAERAGFRACKRCRPGDGKWQDRHARIVADACRSIDIADHEPNLESLARAAGMSRFHFHRVFKQLVGVTPKAYATARKAARVRAELRQGGSVTKALYDAGYATSGRFYETSQDILGMTPVTFKGGGAGTEIRFAVKTCSLGHVIVAATPKGICSISLAADPHQLVRELRRDFPQARIAEDPCFDSVVAAVVDLVDAVTPELRLPLDVRGTSFQHRVWEALRAIPYGRTVTYGELAAAIGMPTASRAVARACASNPAAIAIPCHRVVSQGRGIGGYRWGVERKRTLIDREKTASPRRAGTLPAE
jgi:AraC family transcriptional regulator of adaptative response/methylated-DNA-[protein]-cysteine methyltransferase